MGTHAEVWFHEEAASDPIIFYQHFDGYDIAHFVADALHEGGMGRINDPPYLARIIFTEMIRNGLDNTTGYGITQHSAVSKDYEYIVKVRCNFDNDTWIYYNDEEYKPLDFMHKFSKKWQQLNPKENA
jgi:hypothetical protein